MALFSFTSFSLSLYFVYWFIYLFLSLSFFLSFCFRYLSFFLSFLLSFSFRYLSFFLSFRFLYFSYFLFYYTSFFICFTFSFFLSFFLSFLQYLFFSFFYYIFFLSFIFFKTYSSFLSAFSLFTWPSRLGLQNTPSASLKRSKTPPTSVLDMTLNNLIVRLQGCWGFEECWVPLHCHRSQVLSGPN